MSTVLDDIDVKISANDWEMNKLVAKASSAIWHLGYCYSAEYKKGEPTALPIPFVRLARVGVKIGRMKCIIKVKRQQQ